MEERSFKILETPLPENYGLNFEKPEAEQYIKKVLNDLPKTERVTVDREVKWHFKLDKESREKKAKSSRKRKTYVTRKERKKLNLLKLPKTGWDYASLDAVRAMWKDYMRENLELQKAPLRNEPDYSSLSTILGKSEYVGAEVTVTRSTLPSVVGISGTIVLETKATFQIVNKESKLKTILKENSMFEICLDNLKFTVFGKHLVIRPGERSVKKIKSCMYPDI